MWVAGTTRRGTGVEKVYTFFTLDDLLELYGGNERFRAAFDATLGEAVAKKHIVSDLNVVRSPCVHSPGARDGRGGFHTLTVSLSVRQRPTHGQPERHMLGVGVSVFLEHPAGVGAVHATGRAVGLDEPECLGGRSAGRVVDVQPPQHGAVVELEGVVVPVLQERTTTSSHRLSVAPPERALRSFASMPTLRAASITVFIALIATLLPACNKDFRLDLNGFDSDLGVTTEHDLRGTLMDYHVPHEALDCMVTEAFKKPPRTVPGIRERYNWTAEELNAFATACGVDLTTLWRMGD
jgi:hypothetical protein